MIRSAFIYVVLLIGSCSSASRNKKSKIRLIAPKDSSSSSISVIPPSFPQKNHENLLKTGFPPYKNKLGLAEQSSSSSSIGNISDNFSLSSSSTSTGILSADFSLSSSSSSLPSEEELKNRISDIKEKLYHTRAETPSFSELASKMRDPSSFKRENPFSNNLFSLYSQKKPSANQIPIFNYPIRLAHPQFSFPQNFALTPNQFFQNPYSRLMPRVLPFPTSREMPPPVQVMMLDPSGLQPNAWSLHHLPMSIPGQPIYFS